MARAIPTINDPEQQQDYLKIYQQNIANGITNAPVPIAPWNFSAKNQRGGILLTWSAMVPSKIQGSGPQLTAKALANQKADGYELQRSATGDFSTGKYISIPLRDPTQNSYFDSLGGVPQTFYYRIRATNGTQFIPYGVNGLFTGVVKHTSIDASDTNTVPTTVNDNFTTSLTQKRAGAWKGSVVGTMYPQNR